MRGGTQLGNPTHPSHFDTANETLCANCIKSAMLRSDNEYVAVARSVKSHIKGDNMLSKAILVAAALALPAAAQAAVVTFDATPSGAAAEGFSATGEPGITFFGVVPGNLQVGNFGSQSGNSQALAAFNDTNGNFIRGVMGTASNAISMDFGNDDAAFSNPGDLATLTLFNGATQVGQVTVALNRDDVMNQTISFSGATFTSWTFAYTDAAGNPFTGGGQANVGLIEIIDNINYRAVPEPATWAMMIAGFGLAGAAMRRRSSQVVYA
jgi:hypothetical protein